MAQQHSMRKRKRIDGLSMIPSRLLLPEIIVEIGLKILGGPSSISLNLGGQKLLWTRRHQYVHPRLIFSLKSKPIVSFSLPVKLSKPVSLIGSCNGLLCIVTDWITPFLYNPSTRIYKRLPFSGLSLGVRYTFGYDLSSDDYKVAVIYGNKAKMYSLKFGRWKDINDVPHIPSWCHGTFSNTAFHWMVRDTPMSYHHYRLTNIVSLDLANETYGEVSPPPLYGDKCDGGISLRTLGEWLCVIVHYKGMCADLWVMKVYGVKDSWTKLVSIPYYTKVGFYVLMSMSNDGRFLLTSCKKIGCL
ncbi:F-box associated domain containing protein [Tanacetum coccineum]